MRYTSFVISNFKGIQHLELDLGKHPISQVAILVGLNESGKTTIMEALSFFYETIRNANDAVANHLTLNPSGITDKHSLIPKNKKDNFTDSISIAATLELEEDDVCSLKKILKENNFVVEYISSRMTIEFEFKFDNSSFQKTRSCWGVDIKGKEGRKKTIQELSDSHEAWGKAYTEIKKMIPPIIYYPNFLFDFPDVIYLEESPEEGREQAFYRRLLQDVLDSLDNKLTLEKHIIDRVKPGASSQQKESLKSVLNKMSARITKLVFSEELSIFRTDTRNKSITVSYPEIDKNNIPYVELQIKDGEDNYYIRERSLGFRWFFTFLLFTQFRVRRYREKINLVFLFDEPASNLHQAAQQRLVTALEELTKSGVSVIYSTHSHHLINPKWLENTFIVRNKALEYDKDDVDSFEPTNIEVEKYRSFICHHPNQHTYYQPILDVLEYRPSNLEAIRDIIMLEGKNDFYTLSYFQDVIIKSSNKVPLLPGTGCGSLDTAIRLYYAWGKKFVILLDSDEEGRHEKNRYLDLFGSIVSNRVFTIEDINPLWANKEIENIFSNDDKMLVQKSSYNEKKYKKKLFNLAMQENLVNRNYLDFSPSTKSNLEKILNFLGESLAK